MKNRSKSPANTMTLQMWGLLWGLTSHRQRSLRYRRRDTRTASALVRRGYAVEVSCDDVLRRRYKATTLGMQVYTAYARGLGHVPEPLGHDAEVRGIFSMSQAMWDKLYEMYDLEGTWATGIVSTCSALAIRGLTSREEMRTTPSTLHGYGLSRLGQDLVEAREQGRLRCLEIREESHRRARAQLKGDRDARHRAKAHASREATQVAA